MSKSELIEELKAAAEVSARDPEVGHSQADCALVEFINDPDVTEAFEAVERYYA